MRHRTVAPQSRSALNAAQALTATRSLPVVIRALMAPIVRRELRIQGHTMMIVGCAATGIATSDAIVQIIIIMSTM